MAGVKGWYSAIGWNQPGIVSAGVKALEMSGRRISGCRHVAGGLGVRAGHAHPDRDPGECQGEQREQSERRQPLQAVASVDRKPMATATAPTRTRLASTCSTLPTTCPMSTEPR
jgi:hypothetical protein